MVFHFHVSESEGTLTGFCFINAEAPMFEYTNPRRESSLQDVVNTSEVQLPTGCYTACYLVLEEGNTSPTMAVDTYGCPMDDNGRSLTTIQDLQTGHPNGRMILVQSVHKIYLGSVRTDL